MNLKVIVSAGILVQALALGADCYSTGVLRERELVGEAENGMILARLEREELYGEFKSLWLPLLKRAGRVNIQPAYLGGVASIKYDSRDNLAVRGIAFDEDVLAGDPVENVRKLCDALEESGLRVAGAFAVPAASGSLAGAAGAVYYLTAREELQDKEIRLRYLKFPDPEVRIGPSLLEKAGVRIALRSGPAALFYIGKRLGVYVLKADSEPKAAAQAQYYTEMVRNGEETLIGIETDSLEDRAGGHKYITKIFTYR